MDIINDYDFVKKATFEVIENNAIKKYNSKKESALLMKLGYLQYIDGYEKLIKDIELKYLNKGQ